MYIKHYFGLLYIKLGLPVNKHVLYQKIITNTSKNISTNRVFLQQCKVKLRINCFEFKPRKDFKEVKLSKKNLPLTTIIINILINYMLAAAAR